MCISPLVSYSEAHEDTSTVVYLLYMNHFIFKFLKNGYMLNNT